MTEAAKYRRRWTWVDPFGMTRHFRCGGVIHSNRDLALDRCACPLGEAS